MTALGPASQVLPRQAGGHKGVQNEVELSGSVLQQWGKKISKIYDLMLAWPDTQVLARQADF